MYESLFIMGIVFAIIAGGFLITTVTMFFAFNIPALRTDMSGTLEQKQIEEIRKKGSEANQRDRVNVFEELEKKAKVRRTNTQSLNIVTTTDLPQRQSNNIGTSVLTGGSKSLNPNFIIEKNIMFVSTYEVM